MSHPETMSVAQYREQLSKGKVRVGKVVQKDLRPWNRRYASEIERRFAEMAEDGFVLDGVLSQVFQDRTRINSCEYQPVSFRLPGGKYTPDFEIFYQDSVGGLRRAYIECKPAPVRNHKGKQVRVHHSYRDSRSKLRAIAALRPQDRFMQAEWSRETGWKFTEVS